MQKLLRPSSSAPIVCTVGSPSLSFCLPTGIHNLAFQNPRYSHSIGPSRAFLSHSSSRLPTMSAFASSGSSLAPSPVSKKPFTVSSALSSRYLATLAAASSCSCTCRGEINHRTLSRAWVVVKDGRIGHRAAWFHSVSDGSSLSASVQETSNSDNCVARDSGEDGHSAASLPSSEEKALKLNRRPKGSSSGSCDISSNPDLLTIPGVGPRNLRKLVEKGFAGVAELKQLYKDKFSGKPSDKMVEYLQSSVGIIHRNHAESITTYIKKSVDEESEADSSVQSPNKDRITLCVEGNISVGKTTFLQRIANETIELRDLVEVVPEPIDKWQDVGPDHFNILDAFYAEPQRYAYTFQNYVFVTRVMQERESSGGIKPLRLMERSVFSDRMVFVRSVHEANWMNEMEISIYDSWFDPVVSCLPGLIPDGFIYLRASPDTCLKRMKLRKRAEEGGVTLDYLHSLHEKHESWLFPSQSGNHGVLSISKLPLHIDNSLHPDIRDRVFYLEGDHMHSSIQKVPALVLDCEPNIDFSKDIEAKREYARQVAEFFEFVKKRKENTPKESGNGNRKSQQQVLLPQSSGLWVPDGKHFPPSALNSLEFRRAMSSFISSK